MSDRKPIRPNFDHNNRSLRKEYYDWVESFSHLGKDMLPHEKEILAMVTVCGWGLREMLRRTRRKVTDREIRDVFKKYPHLRILTKDFHSAYKKQAKREQEDFLSRSISLNEAFDNDGNAVYGKDEEKE